MEDWFNSFTDDEQDVLLRLALNNGFISKEILLAGKQKHQTVCNELEERQFLEITQERYQLKNRFASDWLKGWVRFDEKLTQFAIPRDSAQDQVDAIPLHGIAIDLYSKAVFVDGVKVDERLLIPSVLDALMYLARQPRDRIVPLDELATAIRHQEYYEGDNAIVTTVVHRLREALGPKAKEYLLTKYKQGYWLNCEIKLLNDDKAKT